MTGEKNTPELRFPGFTGEWQEKKLGEVFKSISSGKTNPKLSVGEYILYGSTGAIKKIEKYDYSGKKILIARVGENTGFVSLVQGKYGVTDNTLILDNYNDLNIYYYYYYLCKYDFRPIKIGSGQPLITGSDLKKIRINIPSLPEQEKIGSFFSSLDRKLELQKERIEELKSYKKGMMQRIFNQEIRFKDKNGKNYPDWQEKKLGEISESISSNISLSSLKEKGLTPVYDVNSMVGYSDFDGVNSDYISIIKDGSGVGRVKILPKGSLFISTMNGIITKSQDLYFLYLLLSTINFEKYIVGSGIPHIYFKDYSSEKINLPSLPEQEKIASFLSAIDRKLELEEEKLEAYEKLKKGLMQRMFI